MSSTINHFEPPKALGDASKVRIGTVWIVVSVLMLIPSIMFGSLGPFLYIVVWYFAWQRPQTKYIHERWGKDYPRKGWGMPLASAVFIYVAIIAVLMGVAVALAPRVS